MNIITMAHGSGGSLTGKLIKDIALKHFKHPTLQELRDQALVDMPTGRIGFTTDSYVIRPLFFPGGNIGKLSVCGTVNDLAVGGVVPYFITLAAVLEEGLPIDDLDRVVGSAAAAAEEAGVSIVAGDTKVVERGRGDGIYLTTAGIGNLPAGRELGPGSARPGDYVMVNGYLGDHSVAILAARGDLGIKVNVISDCAPLNSLVETMLEVVTERGDCPVPVRCMRDLTRGGLSTTLCELVSGQDYGLEIEESKLPVREAVAGVCEILGLDPLYLANEGKLVAFVAPDEAEIVLEKARSHRYGREAAIIGRVVEDHPGRVRLLTRSGGRRVLAPLTGSHLPRIC
ncbi:MAG: hydrogenase expression/formation protein HypE [bacterium]|nr:hydrogenase expression/formation protein HypE [bacterium]